MGTTSFPPAKTRLKETVASASTLPVGGQIVRGAMTGNASAKFTASLTTLAVHEQGDVLQPVYDKMYVGKVLGDAVDDQLHLLGFADSIVD